MSDQRLQICGFAHGQIDAVWPHVHGLVAAATERSGGRFAPEHIRDFLRQRRMQLWAAHDGQAIHAVCVTEVTVWPTGLKEGAVVLAGGSGARRWIGLMKETLEQWATDGGCGAVRVRGRLGWQRLLPDYKWTGVTLEKKLWTQNNPPAR